MLASKGFQTRRPRGCERGTRALRGSAENQSWWLRCADETERHEAENLFALWCCKMIDTTLQSAADASATTRAGMEDRKRRPGFAEDAKTN